MVLPFATSPYDEVDPSQDKRGHLQSLPSEPFHLDT